MVLAFCFLLVLIDIYMKFIEDIMNRFRFIVRTLNCVTKFQGKLLNQRTIGPVNAHLISWPSQAKNMENIW